MEDQSNLSHEFSGHIYIFHAFDIGDDVNLDKVATLRTIRTTPVSLPKYFKNYNAPLALELPHPNQSARCASVQLHKFGAVSLMYRIPFHSTLEDLRQEFYDIYDHYQEQSVADVKLIYKKIEPFISQPQFFQTRASYNILQVNPQSTQMDLAQFKQQFGSIIASSLRFETESLSEYQKNEILDSAIGYYRGNMIIVDSDTTFIYDDDYNDLLAFVEFTNLQQLELQYFDRMLDKKLNQIYEGGGIQKVSMLSYLPFLDNITDPVASLGKLKVDISVITERLEGSIKLAGEPYYSEFYHLLMKKLDIQTWQESIDRKLEIIKDVQLVYQHKTDVIRENVLEILIITLIAIELVIGILSYIK